MNKGEIAKKNFELGFNCAQAVVLAFKEEMGMDELTLKKLIIGFGGGFGRQRLVCGAVCGMTMVLGYLKSDGEDKLAAYSIIQEACKRVKEKCGSIICSELKDGVNVEKKHSCAEICQIAAEITEEFLK